MLPPVNVGHKSLADYATIIGRGLMAEIHRLAEPLQGKRVLHVSATAFGGGVAEINYTLIPLMISAGLDTEWRIIHGEDEFFNVTKKIHNALQGSPQGLTPDEEAIFHRYNALNADQFDESEYDFVIIHDPQPAAVIDHYAARQAHWIWRCHRPLGTEPRRARVSPPLAGALRRRDLPPARVRSGHRQASRGGHLATGDRSAGSEEHGALRRRRRLHRRPVRNRRRPAVADAGLAVRSLEGPSA